MATESKQLRMNRDALEAYWQDLSRRHLQQSEDGFEVICYAGMPPWFNKFIHRYQMKAFSRLLHDQSFADCDVLDVGTGVGRWARWYASWPDARVTGIDIEPERLERARSLGAGPTYNTMSVDSLAFDDASFDVVNSVTVLQHVPHEMKRRAIAEIARVLRPGGRVVLFEVTDMHDDAPHVFPWPAAAWQSEFAQHGLTVHRTIGDHYIPLLRMLSRVHRVANGARARHEIGAFKQGRSTAADRAKRVVLRAAVAVSYPIEDVCRFLPPRTARITGFLLEKPREEAAR
ncbi:MAG: class I SAM-dependent methyltransferase [Dehalococcoidia bacterium]